MLRLTLENLLKVVRVELHTHSDPFDPLDQPEEWLTLHLFTEADGDEDSEIELNHSYVLGTGLSPGYALQVLEAIVGFRFKKKEAKGSREIYSRTTEAIPKVEASPRFLPLTLENIQKVVEIRIVNNDAVGLFLNTCERSSRRMFPTPRLSPSVATTSVEISYVPCPLGYVEQFVQAAAGMKFLSPPNSDPYQCIKRREDHVVGTTEDSGCLSDDQIQRYLRMNNKYVPGEELPLDCLDYGPMNEHILYRCTACRDKVDKARPPIRNRRRR